MSPRRCWIFCTVVDNFGDAGVCWRLARQLAAEHPIAVTLFIDRPQTLAAVEPRLRTDSASAQALDGVQVRPWPPQTQSDDVPEIVISAFGSRPPPWLRARLAGAPRRPIWINLEYLSAERWVEGCHRLRSIKPDDGAVEHFFYPGFAEGTGGLLRERGLIEQVDRFRRGHERDVWLRRQGIVLESGCRLTSLFCYPEAPVAAWLSAIAGSDQPWLVVVPTGVADQAIEAVLHRALQPGERASLGALSLMRLPFLAQPDYDRLLWSCDLNLVRGEDSWVRAHWAGAPFIWQAYRQADDAHWPKVQAFIERMRAVVAPAAGGTAHALKTMTEAWNGRGQLEPAWAAFSSRLDALPEYFQRWRDHLSQQDDLASQLARYCLDRL
jgi:uncharacterized repeat protein (TIGR03837 family)